MKQKDKELLILDLCARYPYHVLGEVIHYDETTNESINVVGEFRGIDYLNRIDFFYLNEPGTFNKFNVEDFKPYLRPMSSMTEDEKEELRQEHIKDEKLFTECLTKAANGDSSMRGKVVPHFAADWCNKNHFDYRGLIPMELALEAPEDMYKLNNK